MPKIDFHDPATAAGIGLWGFLRSSARIWLFRTLPLAWLLRMVSFFCRMNAWRHRRAWRQALEVLQPLLSALPPKRMRRAAGLCRAIRRTGAHTHAPVSRRSRQWLLETFRPEGLETLDQIAQSPRGAIILGTHAGMNAWIGPILIQLGYPLRLMQRRQISPEKLLLLRRDGWTQRVLAYPQPGEVGIHLKRLHDLLCQGQWIQHVADYADSVTGLCGEYLGRQVRCGRVPWVLGRLTGAPLVPVLVLVDERMRARLHVGTPIIVGDAPSGDGALEAAFQTYLRFLASRLRAVPWNLSPSHLRTILSCRPLC